MEEDLRYHASGQEPKEPEPPAEDIGKDEGLDDEDLDDVTGGLKPAPQPLYGAPVND